MSDCTGKSVKDCGHCQALFQRFIERARESRELAKADCLLQGFTPEVIARADEQFSRALEQMIAEGMS